MKALTALGVALMGFSSSANAVAVPVEQMEMTSRIRRDTIGERQSAAACVGGNGPNSRNCWTPGFTADTDMYTTWPETGRVVSYDLTITNTTCNPDGASPGRVCMLINGRYPGPKIEANWGDTLKVTVRNKLQANGTSIHWHGFRMLNSNIQDGTNGITECSLAPGDTKTYQFQATEYGTTWYHSHFSHQYGDGVVGTVQINGPATANYDVDLGTMPMTDWTYKTVYQAAALSIQNAQKFIGPPPSDTVLVNGTNKNANGGGSYSKVSIQAGKRYRLRLINTSTDAGLLVNLDNHNLTVIATDFVPIKPYNTSYLLLNIGQRADVIVTANQPANNYWFRSFATPVCNTTSLREGRAVFTYQGVTVADPTTNPPPNPPTECVDYRPTPHIVKNVPSAQFAAQAKTLPVAVGPIATQDNFVLWMINGTTMRIDPGKPTVKYVAERNNSFPQPLNVVQIPQTSTWSFWIIQQDQRAPPIAHPIHLHGHDAYVLGEGEGQFNAANDFNKLNFNNPTRRDVATLRAGGWLILAYPNDNPGAWLMHCHIAFHVGMGLSIQFLERKDSIRLPTPGSEWYQNCDRWAAYKAGNTDIYPQDDSGLKKRYPPLLNNDMSIAAW